MDCLTTLLEMYPINRFIGLPYSVVDGERNFDFNVPTEHIPKLYIIGKMNSYSIQIVGRKNGNWLHFLKKGDNRSTQIFKKIYEL
jgi:hypothetical protein